MVTKGHPPSPFPSHRGHGGGSLIPCGHRGHVPSGTTKGLPAATEAIAGPPPPASHQGHGGESQPPATTEATVRTQTPPRGKHAPRESSAVAEVLANAPQRGKRATTKRQKKHNRVFAQARTRVYAPARIQGSGAIAGIPTQAPAGATECPRKQYRSWDTAHVRDPPPFPFRDHFWAPSSKTYPSSPCTGAGRSNNRSRAAPCRSLAPAARRWRACCSAVPRILLRYWATALPDTVTYCGVIRPAGTRSQCGPKLPSRHGDRLASCVPTCKAGRPRRVWRQIPKQPDCKRIEATRSLVGNRCGGHRTIHQCIATQFCGVHYTARMQQRGGTANRQAPFNPSANTLRGQTSQESTAAKALES